MQIGSPAKTGQKRLRKSRFENRSTGKDRSSERSSASKQSSLKSKRSKGASKRKAPFPDRIRPVHQKSTFCQQQDDIDDDDSDSECEESSSSRPYYGDGQGDQGAEEDEQD